jgi:hypothetical protein
VLTVTGFTETCGNALYTDLLANNGSSLGQVFTNTTRTNSTGNFVLTVDDATASGWETAKSGGATLSFTNATTRTVDIAGRHLTAEYKGTKFWDHTVSTATPVNIAIANAGTATETRTIAVNSSITVQHNILQATATSLVTQALVLEPGTCSCGPTSGQLTTTYTSGAGYTGKSETMTFTGCGTAKFVDTNGNSADVTLARCT